MENSSFVDLKLAYIKKYGKVYNDEWFEDFDSAFLAAWRIFEDSLLTQSAIIKGMSECWSLRQFSCVRVKIGDSVLRLQQID